MNTYRKIGGGGSEEREFNASATIATHRFEVEFDSGDRAEYHR
jgi:hypothetical protein